MKKKIGVIGGALALACLSGVSYADSVGNSPTGSIVVMSKEESDVAGYFHEKYVFSHPDCLGNVPVDYYGPEINPNDTRMLVEEQKICAQARWFSDGGGDD